MVNDVVDADNFDVSESDPIMVQEQTTTFKETPSTYTVNIAAPRDSTFSDGYSDNVPLSQFLSRPVKIFEGHWGTEFVSSTYMQEFDPWVLWQNDARVKAKLTNFAYGSWDLKLRFVLNGTPFQYGRLMVVYIPYGDQGVASVDLSRNQVAKQMQLWGDSGNGTSDGAHEARFRHFSTYPHAFLNPSSNQVVEMTLPFIWHNNYFALNGTGSSAKETPGCIYILDLNPLRIANPSAPPFVRYTVYGWAENLKLTIPTEFVPTGNFCTMSLCDCVERKKEPKPFPYDDFTILEADYYVPTSDEYNDGPVSSMSSAVASAAGKLSSAPVIGRFARATEIGAGAIGNIARLFGFSTPLMTQNPERYLHRNHGRMANICGEDSSYSLALDGKQEITVDPSTVGVYPNDEMAISSIVTREQWIARCEWGESFGQFHNSNQLIFAGLVSPNMQHQSIVGDTRCITDTPAGHLANMFEFWKGSITYRVEVVCSPYHSGRLKLQFDPFVKNGPLTVDDVDTVDVNARYSTVMDLSEDCSVEFKIDYNSRYPWLRCLQDPSAGNMMQPNSVTEDTVYLQELFDDTVHMGIFTVSCVNDLVAPMPTDGAASASVAKVQVNIFMKCGDDMQFAQPNEVQTSWSVASFFATAAYENTSLADKFVPTSDAHDAMPCATEHDVIGTAMDEHNTLVFFGESVSSIRALIKRYSLVFTGDYNTDARNQDYEIVTRYVPHMPAQVQGALTRRNSFLSYMSPCYLIGRGSTRYKFAYYDKGDNGNSAGQSYQFFERQGLRQQQNTVGLPVLKSTTVGSAQMDSVIPHGYQGLAYTDNTQQSTLEVQLPFYSNTRFILTAHPANVGTGDGEPLLPNPTMTQILAGRHVYTGRDAHANVMQQWHAAGDDFSLHFFTGVPGIFTPTANFVTISLVDEFTPTSLESVATLAEGGAVSDFVRVPHTISLNPDDWNYTLLNWYGFKAIFDEVGVLTNKLDSTWWLTEFGDLETNEVLSDIKTRAVTATVWEDYFDTILLVRYPGVGYGNFLHWRFSSVMWCDVATILKEVGIQSNDWTAKFSRLEPVPIADVVAYFSSDAGNNKWNSKLDTYFRKRFRQQKYIEDAVVQSFPASDPNSWSYVTLNFTQFNLINKVYEDVLDAAWWNLHLGPATGGNAVSVRIALIKMVAGDKWIPQLQQSMLNAYPN